MSSAVEQRQLKRISLPRPILVSSAALGYADSAAVLRDITGTGAFLFTSLPLTKGDVVELFLTLSDSFGISHLAFAGTVVRVEKSAIENSSGVGIHFCRFKELNTSSGCA